MFHIEKYLFSEDIIVLILKKLLDEVVVLGEINFLDLVNHLISIAEYSFYETKLYDELKYSMELRKSKVALDLYEQLYILTIDVNPECKDYIVWSIIDIVCDYCRRIESLSSDKLFDFKYGAIGEKNGITNFVQYTT